MIDQPRLGELMLADRKQRGLSRDKYGELVGLSAAKIMNLEKGRKVKPDEVDKLSHLAFTIGDGAAEEAGSADTDSPPVSATGGLFEREQQALMAEYAEVYELIRERGPSPVPYLPQWGNPHEITDPATQQSVRRWMTQVKERFGVTTSPPAPEPLPVPDPVAAPQPLPDEPSLAEDPDEAEELELATVTELFPTFPDDGIPRYSNGQLRTFKECKREYWLAYYRKLGLPTEKRTGAASIGTRFHRCLAVLYVPHGTERGDPFAELDRTYEEDLVKVAGDEFKLADLNKDVELVRIMLEGYVEWLQETGADQGLEIIASETRLEVDGQFPGVVAHLIAKIDVRARRTLGTDVAQLFIDHKTVGDLTTPTKMLHMDEQMLHYHLIEWLNLVEEGADPNVRSAGALYNMARKVKRTATAKPPFYDRVEVRHNDHELRSYWLRVQGTILDILEFERKLNEGADPAIVAYPNPTKDCSWKCDFFHVCPMFDDGSRVEDFIAANYVTVNPLARYDETKEGQTL